MTHSNEMVELVEEYLPKEGNLQAILDLIKESTETIKGVKGLVMTKTLAPQKEGDPVYSISTWNSQEDFNAFLQSDNFKKLLNSGIVNQAQELTKMINARTFNVVTGWHG